jgi:hypothetical protein
MPNFNAADKTSEVNPEHHIQAHVSIIQTFTVLLVVFCAASAFFGYQSYRLKSEVTILQEKVKELTPTSTPIPSPTPTPEQDVFNQILSLTYPMKWTSPQIGEEEIRVIDKNTQEATTMNVTGRFVTTNIVKKTDNKVSLLFTTDNPKLKTLGFEQDLDNAAGGPMGTIDSMKRISKNGQEYQFLILRNSGNANGSNTSLFLSNPAPIVR